MKKKLGLYLDHELPPSEAESIQRHLRTCEACNEDYEGLAALTESIAATRTPAPPAELWEAIDRRLHARGSTLAPSRWQGLLRPTRVAAAILIAVGFGSLAFLWPQLGEQRAEATTVQFRVLLDNVSSDPDQALRKFLVMYQGVEIRAAEAKKLAPTLNFELPDPLPGGFHLGPVYSVRFGQSRGIVARYERGDELLVAIFHPPVRQEDFGSHKDYPCVIGQHRGHAVSVGDWRLVHVTDPTTCHCVLSKLGDHTGLPQVLKAVAPRSMPQSVSEEHPHGNGS